MQKANSLDALVNAEFIKQIPGFFGVFDWESKFTLVNDTGAQWTGFKSPTAMTGLTYSDMPCKAAEDADLFIKLDQTLKIHGVMKFLGYYCFANNQWKIILGEKYILKNRNNEAIGLVSHFNDFTQGNLIDISRFLTNISVKHCNKIFRKQFFYTIEDNYPKINLSERQSECIFFLLRGKTAKEISTLLYLSPRTIEGYIDEAKNKLHCSNKSELIEKMIALGYMNIIPKNLLQLSV